MGHSVYRCDFASTLCKYDLWKGDLFVLSCLFYVIEYHFYYGQNRRKGNPIRGSSRRSNHVSLIVYELITVDEFIFTLFTADELCYLLIACALYNYIHY